MDGTYDPLELFKDALKDRSEEKVPGEANSRDIYLYFCHVRDKFEKLEKKIGFTWRKVCGYNDAGRAYKLWRVKDLSKLRKAGTYVIIGKSNGNNDSYLMMLEDMKACNTEEEKIVMWSKFATGEGTLDHAISLVVAEDGSKMLHDDGFTNGCMEFSIEAIAGRMEDLSICYALNLFEVAT